MARKDLSLTINCGFARVAMYQITMELTNNRGRRVPIPLDTRQAEFQALFQGCPNFGLSESFFTREGPNSQFERYCTVVLNTMKKKWHPNHAKSAYISAFSKSKWQVLPDTMKNTHSLTECEGCYNSYLELQKTYPAKPVHNPSVVSFDPNALKSMGVKRFTEQCTKDLNEAYRQTVGKSFVDQLAKIPQLGVQKRKSATKKKKEKREVLRNIRNHINHQLADNATLTVLTENESIKKYRRKRLAQAFEGHKEDQPPPKKKKHSPSFENVTWDKEKVLNDVRNWPSAKVNWSQLARDHNVGGKNGGQVVKEFCEASGIEVAAISGSTPHRRNRAAKKRLLGGEISSPALPPPSTIKDELKNLMEGGRFLLGEACAPYTLRKSKTKAGVVEVYDLQVQGRKIALIDLRQKLLERQKKYMRLLSDSDIDKLTTNEAIEVLRVMRCDISNAEDGELRERVRHNQRHRTLVLWHDHGTVLGNGLILITVHVVYDTAVYLTNGEFREKTGHPSINLQTLIEQPEIHMMAMGSSSIDDQAALIADRVECLLELEQPITTPEGIPIHDHLKLFTGDHPASQFERGTQMGGIYKCGSCGCKDVLMDDQAHALQCPRRSLAEIQSIATAGVVGKQALKTKPFDKLKVAELRDELRARGLGECENVLKPELSSTLQDILRGVQRVPSLLLADPTQDLSTLNLEHYDVLDSEPLHDLKGHFHNIMTELPRILPSDLQCKTEDLLTATLSKDKVTGSDLRKTLIQLYLLLSNTNASAPVVRLLQTAVKIGEILYSTEEHRTPRQVLQLYNHCWVHHELCRDLFAKPKEVSRTAMFGIYLHSLTAHSPQQYEVVCQRSVNTENQERLFGQTRSIALATTNRQPQNIIPHVLLRLQAKKEVDQLWQSVRNAESQVRSAAAHVPRFSQTFVSQQFIRRRRSSWQAHLQRISPYLVKGSGVWWKGVEDGYLFADGDSDPDYRPEGPNVLHIRSSTIQDVLTRQKACWDTIISTPVEVPAESIRLYTPAGEPAGMITNTPGQNYSSLPEDVQLSVNISDPCVTFTECHLDAACETHPDSSTFACTVPSSSDAHQLMPLDQPMRESATCTYTHLQQSALEPSTTHCDDPNIQCPIKQGTTDTTTTTTMASHVPVLASNEPPISEIQADLEEDTEIIPPTYDAPSPTTQPTGLTTKHALAIMQALDDCPHDLRMLDSATARIKALKQAKKSVPESLMEKHKRLLATMQQQILARRKQLRTQIQDWEKNFYIQHKRLPTGDDHAEYRKLIRTTQCIRKLLCSWNITV